MNWFLIRLVKYTPFNCVRVFVLRSFLGYDVGKDVYVGRTFIRADVVSIGDGCVLKSNNVISCKKFVMKPRSHIHSGNTIRGSGSFHLGESSRIINNHFFDLSSDVFIGSNSWVAGRSSEFWTHGRLDKSGATNIEIGDFVYIGSGVKISPGVKVASRVLIGLGSVVTRSVTANEVIVLGNPAKVVKRGVNWRLEW